MSVLTLPSGCKQALALQAVSLGGAAQFVDDVLDFTGSTLQLGKPALNDLRSGLATAPVLFAAEVRPGACPWELYLSIVNVIWGCGADCDHVLGKVILKCFKAAADAPGSCGIHQQWTIIELHERLWGESSMTASVRRHQSHGGALQEHPELAPLILRKFKSAGDVELAQRLVLASRGIQRAKELAAEHALLAAEAVRARCHDGPLLSEDFPQ